MGIALSSNGYKKTDAGIIPEDWDARPLADFCSTYSGGTPSTSRPDYYGGDIPWISSGDLNQGIIEDVNGRITAVGLKNSSAKMVEAETLLIALYGATAGVPAITKVAGAINQAVLAIKPRTADTTYLYSWFKHNKDRIIDTYTQGGQPNLSGEIVRKIVVPLPDESEQHRISNNLNDVTALISTIERLITKKQSIKQGMMQRLLTGKARLPGFDTPWSEVALEDLAQIVSGGTPKSSVTEYWDGGIPWCTPTDITRENSRFLRTTERTISKAGLERSSAQLLPAGSLLLCTRATIGEIKIAAGPISTNQGFKSLIPKRGVSSEYLYYKVLTLKEDLAGLGTGSTFLEVSKRDVARLRFLAPDSEEQKSIASVLADADDELDALQEQLGKIRAIKQGMMQELLTGRTRLLAEDVSA